MSQILASGKTGANKYDLFETDPEKVLTRLDVRQLAQSLQYAYEVAQGYSLSGDEGAASALDNNLSIIDTSNISTYSKDLSQLIQTFVANNCRLVVDGASTANAITLNAPYITEDDAPDGNNYKKTTPLPFTFKDNLKFSFRATATNTGATTVSIPGLAGLSGSIDLVDEDGNDLVGGEIILNKFYEIILTGEATTKKAILKTVNIISSSINRRGISYLPKKITVANNSTDSDHDIDFSGGVFNFDDGSGQDVASALTKQIDAAWSAGDNQGGMEDPLTLTGTYTTSGTTVTGSGSAFTTEFAVGDVIGSSAQNASRRITAIASDTSMTLSEAFSSDVVTPESVKRGGWVGPDITYYMFAIYNPTTDVSDYLFSASLASPTMPSGYTKKKRVASMLTNGSSNIFTFNQYGKYFIYLNNILVNTSAVGTSRASIAMDVPPNTFCIFKSRGFSASGTTTNTIFTDLDHFDAVPSVGNAHVSVNATFTTGGQFMIRSNDSGRIGARADNSSSSTLYMSTEGFYDYLLD